METETQHRQTLLNELLTSRHGDLGAYVQPAFNAAKQDPEFISRLIPWNLAKGEIKDTKVVLPVCALRFFRKDDKKLAENAVAALMSLDPRLLVRAYNFSKELTKGGANISGGHRALLQHGIQRYLENREENQGMWDRVALQHRDSLKTLYAIAHYKPSQRAQAVLFKKEYPKGSVFEAVAKLRTAGVEEAAGLILGKKIPFQIAVGALGRSKKEYEDNPELPLALISQMSGQQLIANTNMLKIMGVFTNPMLRVEYDKALARARGDKRVSTLKADKAMQAIKELDEEEKTSSPLTEKILKRLSDLQEEKISQRSIDGDWLILSDCSGSMDMAIEIAKQFAAYLTKSVKGDVHLVFFNTMPRAFAVTGKTLEQIKEDTKYITADGGTSCGCGLQLIAEKKIHVDGVVIISDGGENTSPAFAQAWLDYRAATGISPTVHFFHLNGDRNVLTENCRRGNVPINQFEVTKADYYSMPNLISMIKKGHYTLVDEIMSTPLLTLDDVFGGNGNKRVKLNRV
jgi:hypothetical protein